MPDLIKRVAVQLEYDDGSTETLTASHLIGYGGMTASWRLMPAGAPEIASIESRAHTWIGLQPREITLTLGRIGLIQLEATTAKATPARGEDTPDA